MSVGRSGSHAIALAAFLLTVTTGASGALAAARDVSWILPPETGVALGLRLGIAPPAAGHDRPATLGDDLLVERIVVGPETLTFGLRDARTGEALALFAVHHDNAAPGGTVVLRAGREADLRAAPDAVERLDRVADVVRAAVDELVWVPQTAVGGAVRLVDPDIVIWFAAGAWALLLLALALALGAARPLLATAKRRPGALWLLGVIALATALRWLLGEPWPVNHVEVQRAVADPLVTPQLVTLLAWPLRALGGDPVGRVATLNGVLSALSPALALLLGALWSDRWLGRFAALLLALSPTAIALSRTSTAAVSAAALLLLATFATEVLARRRTIPAALAAGLAWAFAVLARPEMPGYLVALVLWVLFDRRLRGALRRPGGAFLLVLPVATALGFLLVRASVVFDFAPSLSPWTAEFWSRIPYEAWALFIDPATHWPALFGLALLGFAALGGPPRGYLLFAGIVLPLFLVSLSGAVQRESLHHPVVLSNVRYALPALSLLCVLAAAPVAWLWRHAHTRPGRRPWRVVALALLAVGVAGPAVQAGRLTTLSPLQLEHRFLATWLPRLPADARIIVMGQEVVHLSVAEQVAYRLAVARGEHVASAGRVLADRSVLGQAAFLAAPDREAGPAYVYRGWFEYLAPAEAGVEDVAAWRARFAAAGFRGERVVCEVHDTDPLPGRAGGAMELCLFRLVPANRR